MHENRFNDYRIPSGMLIVFLEKALTLIHMETHLDDVSAILRLRGALCLVSPAGHSPTLPLFLPVLLWLLLSDTVLDRFFLITWLSNVGRLVLIAV